MAVDALLTDAINLAISLYPEICCGQARISPWNYRIMLRMQSARAQEFANEENFFIILGEPQSRKYPQKFKGIRYPLCSPLLLLPQKK